MKMRLLSLTLVLTFTLAASATDTCVILKRSTDSVHTWIGIEFYYVEGNYPPGFSFMTNLRGRHVRKLIKMGGRMAIVEPDYTAADLELARKQCATPPAAPATPRQPDAPKQ
jgi:hypothetical protein